MRSGGVKRKLTTVLAADVVGYSGLVAADDEATILRLRQYRELMERLINRHDGRPFGAAGDSLMAEFPSAVEAVRCGLEIQEELAALNREAPPGRAMRLRIGINVGEAIVEAESLYGDAVNIAARLEAIADPGGILMSASAYEQTKNKISAEIESLGRRTLKNLPEPVGVFRVRMVAGTVARPAAIEVADPPPARKSFGARRWMRRALGVTAALLVVAGAIVVWDRFVDPQLQIAAFAAATTYPVPKEPSIVVLPFLNSGGNASQEYLSDGLSEDITTQLTRVAGLFVVGRDSAFSFKGRATQAKFIGRQLGVRYVLQGSVRRADNKVRVSAYLVDAATDQTVWAVSQDRVLEDVFALQDEIATNVVTSLKLRLREGDHPGGSRQYAQYFAAYDTFLKGRSLLGQPSRENLLAARSLFEETTRIDPDFVGGYAGISLTYSHFVRQRFSDAPAADIQQATRYGKIALGKDDHYGLALLAMSNAYLLDRKPDESVALAEAAQAAYPADANINGVLGLMLTFDGRAADALPYIDKAIDLNRLEAFSSSFYFFKMVAAYVDEKYDLADAAYMKYRGLETSTGQGALDKRVVCRRNCLACAAAIKLELSKQPNLQPDDRKQLNAEAKTLATRLMENDPEYLGRFSQWKDVFKNERDGTRMEDDVKAALAQK